MLLSFLVAFIFFLGYENFSRDLGNFNLAAEGKYRFQGKVTQINGFRGNYFQVQVNLTKIISLEEDKTVFQKQGEKDLNAFVNMRFKLTNLQVGYEIEYSPYYIIDLFAGEDSSYRDYLLSNRIKFLSFVASEYVRVIKDEISFITKLRKAIFDKITTYVGYPSYGLVYGLMTGDKNYLPHTIVEIFRKTGTYHFLAVSGMHAGILFFFLFSLFRLMGFRKKTIFFIAIIVLFPIYFLVTGFKISIIRTYLMIVLFFVLQLLDKPRPLNFVLLVTFNLVVLISPQEIHSLSFQLSFLGVWGICLAVDIIEAYELKNRFVILVIVSLGAQFSTGAVLFYYFGYFNYLSIFYNLLIIFLIPLIFIYSLILLASPSPWFSQLVGQFIGWLSEIAFAVLDFFRFDLDSFASSFLKENLWFNTFLFLLFNFLALTILNGKRIINLLSNQKKPS